MAQWLQTPPSRAAGEERFNLLKDIDALDGVILFDMDASFDWDSAPTELSPHAPSQETNPTAPLATATATTRSRRRLAPEERAQRRRKQHRELVARGRAQAKDRISHLRDQERALQKSIQNIIDGYIRAQRMPSASSTRVRTDGAVASLRDRFVEAVVVSESLHRDNLRLASEVDTKCKFHSTASSACQEMEGEQSGADAAEEEHTQQLLHHRGYWVFFADDDVPFYYEPYTEAQCEELMGQTYANAQRLHEAFATSQYPTMSVWCFGWNVQRMIDATSTRKLRFHFSKQITTPKSCQLREELVRKTWSILNTPGQYAKLYRDKMVEQLLQRVGDHTSIIVRNNPTPLHALTLRSFNMMRAYTDVDAQGRRRTHILVLVLGSQGMEGISQQASRGIVYIRSGFTYISFVELNATTLEVTYGGKGDVVSHQHAAYLLSEIGCTWLRWENTVLPQRLLVAE